MTDGAARVLELYGSKPNLQEAFKHLTSDDPSQFWTSGQWMTERTGGSDVSGTSTMAKSHGQEFTLTGSKWFTSATTSQVALTLARMEDSGSGSRGLSLFFVKLHDHLGNLNHIGINRLKDKLGTRALPTAELELQNTPATLIGLPGEGVKRISTLFNITRIYNACCAVGYIRRGLALALDYSKKRVAFGKPLLEHPLHRETLFKLQNEFEGAFYFVFHAISLLGKVESNAASEDEIACLRLITPLVKLYTAKQSIAVISEILESFGGAGYVEETGLPRLLRDCQVLSIWEGTTNILSLDVLRAIEKENSGEPFLKWLKNRLAKLNHSALSSETEKTLKAILQLETYLDTIPQTSEAEKQANARQFAFSLAEATMACLLIENGIDRLEKENNSAGIISAKFWCATRLKEMSLFQISDLEQRQNYFQDLRAID